MTRTARPSLAGISRRSAVAALGLGALALLAGTASPMPAEQANEPAGAPALAGGLHGANVITAPQVPGALPLFCEEPREIDLGDTLVIATPHYSVSLPKSLLGEGFAWTWDDTEQMARCLRADDKTSSSEYPARYFLSVDPGNGDTAFTVFTTGSWYRAAEYYPPAILDQSCQVYDLGFSDEASLEILVATTPAGERWLKFVSPNTYAFTQREGGGTRVYTPHYSVLVPDGWIDETWSFTYYDGFVRVGNGGLYGKRLDIYANDADREANDPAMSYLWHDKGARRALWVENDYSSWTYTHREAYIADIEYRYIDYTFRALSWEIFFANNDDWIEALCAVELWSDLVSTQITQQTLQRTPIPTSADLWRIETPWFSFDVPERWRGRVQVIFDNAGSVDIVPNGLSGLGLLQIGLMDSYAFPGYFGGDIAHSMLLFLDNDRGQTVAVGASNYPFLLGDGGWREGTCSYLDPAAPPVEQEAVDMATGGLHSAEEVLANGGDTGAYTAYAPYHRENTLPGLQVAMGGEWAQVRAFFDSLDGNWTSNLAVADFYTRAVDALGDPDTLGWVFDLAGRDDVLVWADHGCPVSNFLVEVLAPVLGYDGAPSEQRSVRDFLYPGASA